ncbi:MAG: hypothetical protein WD314_08810 [Trueperaceae bacterium]
MSLESAELTVEGLRFDDVLAPPRWDSSSTEIEVWCDNQGRECAYGQVAGGQPWMHIVGIGDFRLDAAGSATVVPGPSIPSTDVVDTYYRTVLPMALQLAGREVLHASAVVMPRGVLALCAVSETGKSTLAYAMTRRGHELYADDAVAFDVAGPYPILSQIPFSLRLRQASAEHFGERSRESVRVKGPRPVIATGKHELAAICVLERQAGERAETGETPAGAASRVATVERLMPAAAFSAILPHAYCFSLSDSDRKKRMMQHYLALARLIPVLRLRFLSGLGNIPAILNTLEDAVVEHCLESGEPLSKLEVGDEVASR